MKHRASFRNPLGPEPTALSFGISLTHAGNAYSGTETVVTFDLPERELHNFLLNAAEVCAQELGEQTLDETGSQIADWLRDRLTARRDPHCVVESPAHLQLSAFVVRGPFAIPFTVAFESDPLSPLRVTDWLEEKFRLVTLKLFDIYERVNAGLGREKCDLCGEFIEPVDEAHFELLEAIGYFRANYQRKN